MPAKDTLLTPQRTVRAASGEVVRLERRLAVGGQGEVWLAEDGRRIAKILLPEVVRRLGAKVARERLARLIALPLDGLDVCRPTGLLSEPDFGYVADYLPGRLPIGALMAPPSDANPMNWWHETGGLKRRVRLLARIADTLRALHLRGLVYGDLSESNVLIHTDASSEDATLIDLDNLTHHGGSQHAIQTPWFGAPELVRGQAMPSASTDVWSFAVLVSWCLQLCHPFMGGATQDDDDRQTAAFRGELPWVDDLDDRRNKRTSGLPPNSVLSISLLGLMRRTFGAEGRTTPSSRPALYEWADALFGLGDRMIHCRVCGLSFNDGSQVCAWCDNPRPRHARVEFYRWLPGPQHAVERPGGVVVSLDLKAGSSCELTRRVTEGASDERKHASVVRVRSARKGLEVSASPRSRVEVRLRLSGTRDTMMLTPKFVPFDPNLHRLHFGPLHTPHRVAIIKFVDG